MAENEDIITLSTLKSEINALLFAQNQLRKDWEMMQDKFLTAFEELDALKKRLETRTPSKLPYTPKELMQLKSIGIKPQDLLRQEGFTFDEEKKGNERQEISSSH